MVQCGVSAGCKNPELDGAGHKQCSECLHNLCAQAAKRQARCWGCVAPPTATPSDKKKMGRLLLGLLLGLLLLLLLLLLGVVVRPVQV